MFTRFDLGRPLVALHRTDLATLAIVGGLLSYAAPAVVPAVLLSGYLVRTMAGAIRGDDRPPAIGDWRATARHGLAATALVAVVSLPAVVARAATTRLAVRRLPLGPGLVGAATRGPTTALAPLPSAVPMPGVALLAGVATTVCLAVVAAYASTIGLGIYAATGSLRAALSPRRLLAVGRTRSTVLAAVGCVAVASAAALAGRLAAFVPVGGPFVGAVVTFLGSVVAVRLYGRNATLPTPADVGRDPAATPAPDLASDATGAERDAVDPADPADRATDAPDGSGTAAGAAAAVDAPTAGRPATAHGRSTPTRTTDGAETLGDAGEVGTPTSDEHTTTGRTRATGGSEVNRNLGRIESTRTDARTRGSEVGGRVRRTGPGSSVDGGHRAE